MAAVLYGVAVWLAGGSVAGAFVFYAVALALVVPAGLALCRWLAPRMTGWAPALPVFTLGSVCLVLSYVLFGWLGWAKAAFIPNLALALVWAGDAVHKKRWAGLRLRVSAIPLPGALLVLLFSALAFLYVFSGVFSYARPIAAGNMTYSQDVLWAVGNAAGVHYGMPPRDLRSVGGVLHYHFFSDAEAGLLALFSGQSAWDAVCYYTWPVWMGLLLLGLYQVSRRLGAGPWQALLPPVGVTLLSFLDLNAVMHVLVNPNNVLQSYVFALALLLVARQAEAEGFKPKGLLAVFALSALALVWTKSVTGVLLLCALAAALVVWCIARRKISWWLLAALGLSAGAAALLFRLLFSGAHINMFFQPGWAPVRDMLLKLAREYAPGLVLYAAAAVWCLLHIKTLSYAALVVNAMVPGGLAAYVLFYHYGSSNDYFYLAACMCMWLCVACALPFFTRRGVGRAAVAVCCLVALAGTAVKAAPTLRGGVQAALRCAGLRPPFERQYASLTPDDEAAALWLKAHMGPDDVFATNRNERSLESKDGIFHGYTALAERQAFVEGWSYAMDYTTDYFLLRHNLEVVSDGIFACESYADAARMAKQNGIGYLLLHLPTKGAGFSGGEPVFSSNTVLVYRVE